MAFLAYSLFIRFAADFAGGGSTGFPCATQNKQIFSIAEHLRQPCRISYPAHCMKCSALLDLNSYTQESRAEPQANFKYAR